MKIKSIIIVSILFVSTAQIMKIDHTSISSESRRAIQKAIINGLRLEKSKSSIILSNTRARNIHRFKYLTSRQPTSYYMLIDQPGYYELTEDIINCTYEAAIYINTSNVTLDGKNHIVDGVNNESSKYGIYICNATNITIRNLKIYEWNVSGIYLYNSKYAYLLNNEIAINYNGIHLHGSSCNNITNNTILKNSRGILLSKLTLSVFPLIERYPSYNKIYENKIQNNSFGIREIGGSANRFYQNIIEYNDYGIYLYGSRSTVLGSIYVYYNNVTANKNGTYAQGAASTCYIYLNNFIDNTQQYYCIDEKFLFRSPDLVTYHYGNSTYTNYTGNYWDDYNGSDTDKDGIGDIPYCFDGYINDTYPLMGPWFPQANKILDIIPPLIDILFPQNCSYLNSSNITVKWNSSDNSGINKYEVYLNGSYIATTHNTSYVLNLSNGNYNITIIAYDFDDNIYSDTVTFTVDLTAPSVAITDPPNNFYADSPNVTVSWTGSDASGIDHYEIRIDNGAWIDVGASTSYTFTGLGEGYHTVDVRAFDYAGNVGSDSVTFTVDLTKPSVTIDSPKDGDYFNTSSVTVSWTGSDASGIDHYEIRIDNGAWIDVGASTSYTFTGLGEGYHTVDVRAFDYVGNVGSDSVTFTVDLTKPSVTIDSPKDGDYFNTSSVTVSWTGSDNYGIDYYEICIDDGPWIDVDMSTNYTFTGLDEGNHTICIKAYDFAGNIRLETLEIVIDLAPPSIEIMYPCADFENETYVYWQAQDGASHINRAEVYLNGSLYAVYIYGINMTYVHYFDLPDGRYNICVIVFDAVNHSMSDCCIVVFDKTKPTAILLEPENDTWCNYTNIMLNWQGQDNYVIDYYEIRVDNETWINVGLNASYILRLNEGSHTIKLRVIDKAGNRYSVAVQIHIDLAPPYIAFLEPSIDTVSSNTISIRWSAVDNFEISHFEVYINDSCVYIGNDSEYIVELPDGQYLITVRAYDIAGNRAEAHKNIIVDTAQPTIHILSPTNGQYLNISKVNVSWEYEEKNLDHIELRIDYGSWINVGENTTFVVELKDGDHLIEIKVYDKAGNMAKDSIIFIVDTTPPEIDILEPENNSVVDKERVTIRIQVLEDNLEKVLANTGSGWREVNGNEFAVKLRKGENRIYIRAVDKAGNVKEAVLIVTLKQLIIPNYALYLVLAMAVGTIVAVFWRKKRKSLEETEEI